MEFASRITITCFAATYAISLINEVARVFWPSRAVRWIATTTAAAGIFAQTLFLIAVGVQAGRLPITTQFHSLITVSWLISLVYLYLTVRDRRLAWGLFLLPISLGLLLYATTLSVRPGSSSAGGGVIGISHGLLLISGTLMVTLAFAAAVMYLVKVQQLKTGIGWTHVRLPSLERLDRVHELSVLIAWPLLTVGIAMGLLMQKLRWTDPKVFVTLLAWTVFTTLTHYRFQPEQRGRRLALLTIVAFIVVLVSFLGDPLFGTGHQSVLEGAP